MKLKIIHIIIMSTTLILKLTISS